MTAPEWDRWAEATRQAADQVDREANAQGRSMWNEADYRKAQTLRVALILRPSDDPTEPREGA